MCLISVRQDMSNRDEVGDVYGCCNRCGSSVSKQFVRVFGLDNTVFGCIDCLTRKELSEGEAAIPNDAEPASHSGWEIGRWS